MTRTFYDVLMLSPTADSRLVTVVYRHLAKRYHPDVDLSPEAAARMAELNEAYATLSDRTRRARYDEQMGIAAVHTHADAAMQQHAMGGRDAAVVQEQAAAGSQGPAYGEAGPPPPNPPPSGAVLTFGRYRGWTLNQVGRFDRDYLEWLARTTMGRNYRRELDQLLRKP